MRIDCFCLLILFIQIVLSVVWSGGKLGSAYYDTEMSQLYLQMDVIETNDFQFLKRGEFILLINASFPIFCLSLCKYQSVQCYQLNP